LRNVVKEISLVIEGIEELDEKKAQADEVSKKQAEKEQFLSKENARITRIGDNLKAEQASADEKYRGILFKEEKMKAVLKNGEEEVKKLEDSVKKLTAQADTIKSDIANIGKAKEELKIREEQLKDKERLIEKETMIDRARKELLDAREKSIKSRESHLQSITDMVI